MPVRILDRQAAVARVGKIRMGETRISTKSGNPYPAQRETFRFTSANKAALEMLQQAYGGTLRPWKDHPGEWELDSKASQISVIVDTTMSVDDMFEQYDGKTRTHYCDGLECQYFEIKRDRDRNITLAKDHGTVPCRCSSDGQGPDPDNRAHCYLKTTLRVMVPATGDIMLWEFASKGQIFNKEVRGAIDTFRQMGIRQGYCHLSINMVEKVRGNDVSKFGVARLTLDPNPPNFVAQLMARTPAAQAQALMMASQQHGGAPALPSATPQLPAPSKTEESEKQPSPAELAKAQRKAHSLTKEQWDALMERSGREPGAPFVAWLEESHAAGIVGFDALMAQLGPAQSAPDDVNAYLLKVCEAQSLIQEFKDTAGEAWQDVATKAMADGVTDYDVLMALADDASPSQPTAKGDAQEPLL